MALQPASGHSGFSRTFDRLVKRSGVRRITVRLTRHARGTPSAFLTHAVGDGERKALAMLAKLLEDPLIG